MSRLTGYDRQETPRAQRWGKCKVPTHLCLQGPQFLVQKLDELRQEILVDQARILGDCYEFIYTKG